MDYPFPGMDPYLEHAVLWEGVHARLIVAIANQLQPQIDPRYVASVEERVYIELPQRRIPDAWIQMLRQPLAVAQPLRALSAQASPAASTPESAACGGRPRNDARPSSCTRAGLRRRAILPPHPVRREMQAALGAPRSDVGRPPDGRLSHGPPGNPRAESGSPRKVPAPIHRL
jgi:hypothetical protein